MLNKIHYGEEPANATTHFVSFWIALFAGLALVVKARHDWVRFIESVIYGIALAALFLASSFYHYYDLGPRGNLWLRRLDHSAIYLLISACYVPTFIHGLDGHWRTAMLITVTLLMLGGIFFKLVWLDAPRGLSVSMYLALGWLFLIPAHKILPQIPLSLLAWFFASGIVYSLGALIYLFEKPDPWPNAFGFHEIWHLFVMAGAALHYIFAYKLIDQPYAPF